MEKKEGTGVVEGYGIRVVVDIGRDIITVFSARDKTSGIVSVSQIRGRMTMVDLNKGLFDYGD